MGLLSSTMFSNQDILALIRADPWMMNILRTAEELHLPDWAIGAGFVRNKVWDRLHDIDKDGVAINDIDLVYFDPEHVDQQADEDLSKRLSEETGSTWEIVNEAYAHEWNSHPPYKSTEDAISQWTETATCVGVRLNRGELELIAPHGIEDLVQLIVRPTPLYSRRNEIVKDRARRKKWFETWTKLTFLE
jgi:hypothetical protein